jgi:hypothetical protein
MPFREETGIIRGFDEILTELAIFRTRKVHLPVRWHRAVHKGKKHKRSTWHGRWDKHPQGYFLHSTVATKCPWHGMQKGLTRTKEDDRKDLSKINLVVTLRSSWEVEMTL